MSSARFYLESNVVDRLSKPIIPGGSGTDAVDLSMDHNERPVMDMASFMNSLHMSSAPQFSTPSSTKQGGPIKAPNSAASSRAGGGVGVTLFGPRGGGVSASTPGGTILTAEEKEKRRAQFEQFMGRQEQSLARKERNIKEVRYVMLCYVAICHSITCIVYCISSVSIHCV